MASLQSKENHVCVLVLNMWVLVLFLVLKHWVLNPSLVKTPAALESSKPLFCLNGPIAPNISWTLSPPDLCICTKYGFVVVVCRKYSQKIDFPERKVQLYCFIAGFSFVYYSAYKLKACYAAVQLKVCYAAFRLKCKTLSCRRETARCLCHWIFCEVTQGQSKWQYTMWGVCKSLLVFHWNCVCISYRFRDIQRQRRAWPRIWD